VFRADHRLLGKNLKIEITSGSATIQPERASSLRIAKSCFEWRSNWTECKVLPVTTSHNRILAAVFAGISLLIVFAVFNRSGSTVPPFEVTPLPKGTHTLTTSEVEDLLTANFKIDQKVQQIPAPLKRDYTALANEPFEMVNPGQEMSTDDIIPGVPNKKLVLVGLADQSAVLIFIRGGYVDTINAAVFSHKGTGGMWGATIEDYSVRDIQTLRNAVHNGRFKVWQTPK
jgi:hypothetical protein